jgi:CRP/FNR family transcriptional regulator, nitrogen oxide reductase regulator
VLGTGARRAEAASALLTGLSAEEQRGVLERAASSRLAQSQALFLQGEPALALHQVVSGRLRLGQTTPDGQSVTVRFTGPGELCAALAVLDGKSYPFTATAVVATVVLSWSRTVLEQLFASSPRLERNVLQIVGAHGRETMDKLRELATEPVARRLARALLDLVRLGHPSKGGGVSIDRLRQRDLAELTATSPYTVNRVLSEWESRGILERRRATIVLHSQGALRRIAGS